jgi:hypothetical protein
MAGAAGHDDHVDAGCPINSAIALVSRASNNDQPYAAEMSFFFTQFSSTEFHATMLAVVMTAALAGLVAIWTATSRRHWFMRALILWLTIAALLPIRAYEPALILSLSLPLVVAVILVVNRRMSRSTSMAEPLPTGSFRFGLRDLFLLMIVVGLALSIWLQIVRRVSDLYASYLLLACAIVSSVILLSWAMVSGPRRRLAAALLVAIVVVSPFIVHASGRAGHEDVWYATGVRFLPPTLYWSDIATAGLMLAEFALLITLGVAIYRQNSPAIRSRRAHRIARMVQSASALLIGLPLAWLYWQLLWLPPLPPPYRGQQTNFHELVGLAAEAAALEQSGASAPFRSRAVLSDAAIRLLDQLGFVPFEAELTLTPARWNKLMKDCRSLRAFSQAIDGEAADAHAAGYTAHALDLTIANMRLGSMLARGSDLFITTDGDIVGYFAQRRLLRLRDDLSPDQIRASIAVLSQLSAEREPIADILVRDAVYQQRIWGWVGRLEYVLDQLLGERDPHSPEAWWRVAITNELLKADLAIRLYEHDRSQPPASLRDLVPRYLDLVPIDPYSNQPLCYDNADGRVILYSVGRDRHDDGGRFTNMKNYVSIPGYDFDVDTPVRP